MDILMERRRGEKETDLWLSESSFFSLCMGGSATWRRG